MKNKLYKWQKIIIWIIGILTFISITANDYGKGLNIGYFLDLIIGIGAWVLILWALFKIGNRIYLKTKKAKEKNNNEKSK